MTIWQSALISPDTPIRSAIEKINVSSLQVALVVDEQNRLLGLVTDGDVRRAILSQIEINDPVEKIMCKNFTGASIEDDRESILQLMRTKKISQIPILDHQGRIVDLKLLIDMIESHCQKLDNWVILMAGGMGTRLRPLTEEYPKPLLKVGGKPLLETIIEIFCKFGFFKFFISINYKAKMIEDYFGNGSRWGINITYLREDKQLGTAGAIGLIPEHPVLPIFVMNSDLLTKVNFRQLLDFHYKNESTATMCVRQYDFKIPYGVVNTDGFSLLSLEEKPVQRFFVNAGIYVLDPDIVHNIPKNQRFDMTTLFENLIKAGNKTTIYPIHEYWLDIGREDDYDRANGDYCKYFE